ncbi:OmpH family outer membrane protein [Novosphingopyxis sp. YJ-S2-01]|uniref:OmpH family outer membrane protein n=1 Tax=Novosphingopyxis sp. YJ-S2-01 TaxID=2794021 RepID=UPI0018DCC759|nr:OmpH family outer membrane protein [Novosphingopyxis sp. YJ-S2-01]MBH9538695.1 OmpH family outer membrane protein [Novosphingopyxis sp. YJ-S2-01]
MKHLIKAASLALAATTATVSLAAPVAAQQVKGIAFADLEAAARQSSAYTTAAQQRQTTYAAQISQAQSARQAAAQRLEPLANQFNTARQSATPDQTQLQTLYGQIQQIQNDSEQQLQQILQPVALSEAYVNEQISDQLKAAVDAARAQAKVSLLLGAGSVIDGDDAYDLTDEITAQLNRLIPAAQIVPPAGWLPRAQRERLAAQQQAQPAAAAAQPESR